MDDDMDDDNRKKHDDEWYKSKFYYNLKDAYREVEKSSGTEELKNISYLAGKALFNASLFSLKLGVEMIKRAPETLEKAAQNAKK